MLINCPECGKRVSDQAEECPECGYPISSISQLDNSGIDQDSSTKTYSPSLETSLENSSDGLHFFKTIGILIGIGIVVIVIVLLTTGTQSNTSDYIDPSYIFEKSYSNDSSVNTTSNSPTKASTKIKLPDLPLVCKKTLSTGKQLSSIKIIDLKYDGKRTITATCEKIYAYDVYSAEFEWQLYDSEGFLIDSGRESMYSSANVGDKQRLDIYLLNYNGESNCTLYLNDIQY